MEEDNNKILDLDLVGKPPVGRRRELLPTWIKVFTWIFMISGALAPFGLVFGLLGYRFQLGLYGFQTHEPLSLIGLVLTAVILFKGITAFALWTEKDWAISAGYADAIIGIAICIFAMLVYPFFGESSSFHFSFRLELLLLVPYLIKLGKIREEWKRAGESLPA